MKRLLLLRGRLAHRWTSRLVGRHLKRIVALLEKAILVLKFLKALKKAIILQVLFLLFLAIHLLHKLKEHRLLIIYVSS